MKKEIIDFINSQWICVLALEMLDGSPHASTVHFAYDDATSSFLFETYSGYRKAEALCNKKIVRASIVIGFDEKDMRTLQIDGEARLIIKDEEDLFDGIYFGKFPNKKEKSKDPKFLKFSFSTKWWRYTDWTNKSGKVIISSEDK